MRVLRTFTVCLLVFLALAAGVVSAQTEIIAYGDEIEATASASNSIRYEFEGEAGDTISITTTPAESDLQLNIVLVDPNFDTATQQDDAIVDFYLAASGTYEIIVLGRDSGGDFTLALERTSAAEDREVVFEDDFEDNDNDWETGGNSEINADVANGKYVIDANCAISGGSVWFGAPGLTSVDNVPLVEPNYVVEVDVQITESEGAAVIGALFGVVQPGYQAVQTLYYDISGYDRYGYLSGGGIESLGIDDTIPVEIADGEIHHFSWGIWEREVRLWVDGEEVSLLSELDISEGTIGLAGGCGFFDSMPYVHIEFDNLVMTTAPEAAE